MNSFILVVSAIITLFTSRARGSSMCRWPWGSRWPRAPWKCRWPRASWRSWWPRASWKSRWTDRSGWSRISLKSSYPWKAWCTLKISSIWLFSFAWVFLLLKVTIIVKIIMMRKSQRTKINLFSQFWPHK